MAARLFVAWLCRDRLPTPALLCQLLPVSLAAVDKDFRKHFTQKDDNNIKIIIMKKCAFC